MVILGIYLFLCLIVMLISIKNAPKIEEFERNEKKSKRKRK